MRNLAEQPTDATRADLRPLSVDTFIAGLKRRYAGRITGELVIPAREGRYAEFPPELDLRLVTALHKRGIERLYRHQREAWDLVAGDRSTVVVTPTASGKTLCYNLPVLQAALQDQAKSLYLFPTKALSQDQVAEILELNQAGGLGVRAYTFDGDTPGDARKAVRTRGDIVVSNPDMLRQGILPHHTKWAQFFEALRFVVIDELHTYRGVFGSHMANVIRRLRRVCRFYGSHPIFILSSATIANPAELDFVVIDTTGGKQEIIAEVDYSSAPMTIYEGAIYLIQAQPWQVERLDWEGRKAFVTRTHADYYTAAIDYTKLKVLDEFEQQERTGSACARGEVHLVRRIAGYKKIRYYTHENIGYGKIHLPDQEMHTTAVWWQVNPAALEAAFPARWQALDGFLGAAYALHHVAALLTMSERQDLGRSVGDSRHTWFAVAGPDGRGRAQAFDGGTIDIEQSTQAFIPTVFLYDNYPGGIGLSTPLYDLRATVVTKTHDLIAACPCHLGCPTCIGPILASDETHSPKAAALTVLALFHRQVLVDTETNYSAWI